jgi:hypothetical protein
LIRRVEHSGEAVGHLHEQIAGLVVPAVVEYFAV